MATIKKTWISEPVSKLVSGTHLVGGDYLYSEGTSIMARVGKNIVELSKPALREMFNWKHITESRVLSLVGKELTKGMIKSILK